MKKILLICMLLTSWIGVYSQTSSLSIATTSTTSGCNGTIDGTVSIGSVNTTNTSEIDMLITPNQSTGTFNLILSVNWGDGTTSTHQGSGNYGSIGQFMSFNPPIQHTYSSYGNYTVTINYTSTNNGPAGMVTYTYSYNCPITNVYASLAVDCNQDGQTDYSVNDTVPITVVSSTGASYNGQLISNMATFSPALPSGLYTVVIDTNWLNTNNYSVSTNSFTTFQTSGNGGAYTVSFVFNCTTPPGCTTSITQGYNTASGSLMYSSSTPSQISSFVWNIYRYDNLGNQIGTSAFSTQANAYISNDPSISYVVACLDATFTNGCSFSTCDTFSVDNCISGTVYCDANSNGIFDSNENTISNAAIQIQTGNGIQTVYSDINGYYSLVYNSNNPIVINLNPNWSSMTGSTGGVYTLLSENCDSNQVYNVGLNCGSNLPANCYSGYVFCDANNNGVMNAGELPIPFAPVYLGVSPTSNSSVTVYTDSTGFFSYCGQIGTSNIAVAWLNSQWLGYNGYTSTSSLITLVGSTSGNNQPGFLPVICGGTPCTDLWTTVTPWIGYYQNTTAHIKLNWGNYGPTAAGNYQLTLTFPAGVTVNTSSIQNSGYTISGNTITWNLSNLNTTFSTFDYITFQVPGGLLNGAQHYFTSTISPVNSTDCNSQNNAGSLLQILGNSYDPNDKTVQRPDFYTTTPISIGTEILDANQLDALTYTIRFQNTGTAPAQNVYILDTLSSNLDWSTFSLIHASHPVQVVHQSNGLVRFEFDQIWLADSTTNEPESHGDLIYRIAEKSTCLAGCEIENTAYIYFDWNDAIVTNTTYNVNETISGINEDKTGGFVIYPNPANNHIQIRGLETFKYQIHDFAGKSILCGEGTGNEMLDITKLMSGAYFVTIESETAELKVLRFVKN
jgi:uncharacterized repeat protein (TIGR01451 family)